MDLMMLHKNIALVSPHDIGCYSPLPVETFAK